MKKIFLFLCLLLALKSQDFYALTQEVVDLNYQLQNQTASKALIQASKKKERLMLKIAQAIAKKDVLSSDLNSLNLAIENFKSGLLSVKQIQSPYSLAINTAELNLLLVKKSFFDCIQSLAKKNQFFTTRTEIKEMLSKAIESIQQYDFIDSKELSKSELESLQSKQNDLDVISGSYIEILKFLQTNIGLFLNESFLGNFDLSWILEKIRSILPSQFQQLAFAKGILSLAIFIVFFLLRHTIAHLLLYLISTLSHFLENKTIQEQIKEQISTPILWIILLLSFKISLGILLFPNPISPKFKIWVDACFIVSLSWLTILLFKGYGIAILGNIAQKNNVFRREIVNLLLKVIYFLILVITILVLLKNFGFNVSALIASLGIGGVAVAFAIKDMLANFFASVVLLFDNSFNQGDWIVCGDVEGTVIEIGLRRTMIRTFDNAMLFVPNSLLANGSVKNWNRRKSGRRIKFNIGLTYSSTPEQIRACIRDIQNMLLNHPGIAKEEDKRQMPNHYELDLKSNIVSLDDLLGYKRNLFIVLEEFAGSSINILVYCFSKTTVWGEWLNVRQEVMLNIMDILNQHNLSFAFPSQSLYIEKIAPNESKDA